MIKRLMRHLYGEYHKGYNDGVEAALKTMHSLQDARTGIMLDSCMNTDTLDKIRISLADIEKRKVNEIRENIKRILV
jgi:hypothetical protein